MSYDQIEKRCKTCNDLILPPKLGCAKCLVKVTKPAPAAKKTPKVQRSNPAQPSLFL